MHAIKLSSRTFHRQPLLLLPSTFLSLLPMPLKKKLLADCKANHYARDDVSKGNCCSLVPSIRIRAEAETLSCQKEGSPKERQSNKLMVLGIIPPSVPALCYLLRY